MRGLIALFLMTGAAWAQEAPVSTTATYGAWTLGCQDSAGAKSCQVMTRLNVKGQDGQLRPLMALALVPTQAKGQALRAELPAGLDLRSPPRLRAVAKGDAEGEALASFDWLTCDGPLCLAELSASAELVDRLVAAKTVEVEFTLWQGGKAVRVPVSLDGFAAAYAALKAAQTVVKAD